jgi:hypothetical protein
VSFNFSHVMCVVPTLRAGDSAYANMGFDVQRYEAGANSEVHLEQGHIEIVSNYVEAVAARSPRHRAVVDYIAREGGGLIGFALTSDALEEDIERLNEQGLAFGGPFEAKRPRPDGDFTPLRVLRPAPQPCPAVLPSLVAGQVTTTLARFHPNTVTRAHGISIVSGDAAHLVKTYCTLLGKDPDRVADRPHLGAQASVFDLDNFNIEILEVKVVGVAARTLARQGAGPVELQLIATDVGRVAEPLGLDIVNDSVVIPPTMGCGVRMLITTA